MRLAITAFAVLLPIAAHAIDRPGPITLDKKVRVFVDPMDHVRTIRLLRQGRLEAAFALWDDSEVEDRSWEIPAGTQVYADERVVEPEFMECLRAEGSSRCGWGLPVVMVTKP